MCTCAEWMDGRKCFICGTHGFRYLDALRSSLRDKMRKQGRELPSLCCCGETLWDTHPDTCANNCFYYKNHRGTSALVSCHKDLPSESLCDPISEKGSLVAEVGATYCPVAVLGFPTPTVISFCFCFVFKVVSYNVRNVLLTIITTTKSKTEMTASVQGKNSKHTRG